MSTVTMQDLELETAELLPARETLCAAAAAATRRRLQLQPIIVGNTSQVGDWSTCSAFNGEGNSLNIVSL